MNPARMPKPVVKRPGALQMSLLQCDDRVRYLDANAQAVAGEIVAEYERRGSRCLSLDVFDTLLLRNDEPEAYRFFRMASDATKHMAPELQSAVKAPGRAAMIGKVKVTPQSCTAFLARETATTMSYRMRPAVRGCREGHIDDILRVQARTLGIEDFAVLKAIELDIEATTLAPNPAIAMACKAVRERGGAVIAVSDMYLDGPSIEHLIRRCFRGKLPVDEVISSADRVVSKRSGVLFEDLASERGLQPGEFLHIGDSHLSDVRRPVEKGWRAMHFPISTAEHSRRSAQLEKFVESFRKAGIDVSSFAKV